MPVTYESVTHNGVRYSVGDEVEVIAEDTFGGHNPGTRCIIQYFNTYRDIPTAQMTSVDRGSSFFNKLDVIKMIKSVVPPMSVARPDELKAIESYDALMYDEDFFSYTDEEFEIVLRIYANMMKRSENKIVRDLMMKWLKACPVDKLKDFYAYMLRFSVGADSIEKIKELDAQFA